MAVNTRIRSVTVREDATVEVKLASTNPVSPKYEVKLDGWEKWRSVAATAVLGPLDPGVRKLEARSYSRSGNVDPTPAVREFTIEAVEPPPPPPPPPPPEDEWNTVRIVKPGDWNQRLIEGFKGATITTEGDDLRFKVPTSASSGARCEVQTYFGEEGMTCAYQWDFEIPGYVNLKALPGAYSLIHQGHGNEKAGFTSGTKVNNANDALGVSVKGGEELNMSGSHDYRYENEFFLPVGIKRDFRHTIRHEVYWHRGTEGWYRLYLDGVMAELKGIPTWPIGNADGVPTENIMLRYGFYPQWGIVPPGGLEMVCGPMVLQERVA